jgi:hypothetical protein
VGSLLHEVPVTDTSSVARRRIRSQAGSAHRSYTTSILEAGSLRHRSQARLGHTLLITNRLCPSRDTADWATPPACLERLCQCRRVVSYQASGIRARNSGTRLRVRNADTGLRSSGRLAPRSPNSGRNARGRTRLPCFGSRSMGPRLDIPSPGPSLAVCLSRGQSHVPRVLARLATASILSYLSVYYGCSFYVLGLS